MQRHFGRENGSQVFGSRSTVVMLKLGGQLKCIEGGRRRMGLAGHRAGTAFGRLAGQCSSVVLVHHYEQSGLCDMVMAQYRIPMLLSARPAGVAAFQHDNPSACRPGQARSLPGADKARC